MPWCEACNRFLNPPSLTADGACPTCGRVVAEPPGVPWHFKLLLLALVLYLGFRAWQGILWLLDRV
jgi:hypothetical protein